MRAEVGELTRLLQDNLEKGRSARQARRFHRQEHAAALARGLWRAALSRHQCAGRRKPQPRLSRRARRKERLQHHPARDFDASAGSVELFPQEITRALLNLISNGFYAATKRQKENGEEGFEPLLFATTKNLGSTVEIRIRDNGTGIPAEVKEKMFNPFFTTKPAGEGTGLGLSMTHDIIVKQHGGRIDVATKAGQFTEFIVTLPTQRPCTIVDGALHERHLYCRRR